MFGRTKNSRKREARKLIELHDAGQLVDVLDELEADAELREARGDHAGALALRYALSRIRGDEADDADADDEPEPDDDVAPAQDWPAAGPSENEDGEALY